MNPKPKFFNMILYLEPGATFNIIRIGIHYHHPNEEDSCPFKFGIILTVFNINLGIGIFQQS